MKDFLRNDLFKWQDRVNAVLIVTFIVSTSYAVYLACMAWF